jgi:membrane protease YdiL (CAAX protease family)/heme exporter protein D
VKTIIRGRLQIHPSKLLWIYLFLITMAELITSIVSPQLGLIMHALLLVTFMVHGAIWQHNSVGQFVLGLTLAPLIRLLSLSMPLLNFPQAAWYPLVSIPLLIALWLIVRQMSIPRQALGLRMGYLPLQVLLVSVGVSLGFIEHQILQPQPVVSSLTWQALVLPALSLAFFTGFTEEIIFRGLLQALVLPSLGRAGFIYVALLFAALHIGYLSVVDVLFVFVVGVLFAYIVHWGSSILGATLAHGLTNVILFLIMPYLSQHPDDSLNTIMPWVLWSSVPISIVTIALVWLQSLKQRQAVQTDVSPATIRTLRREHGLTYASLAQYTGIPTRKLAAIERGLQPLEAEHRAAIARALDTLIVLPAVPKSER